MEAKTINELLHLDIRFHRIEPRLIIKLKIENSCKIGSMSSKLKLGLVAIPIIGLFLLDLVTLSMWRSLENMGHCMDS